ncbi:superoxide dismutase family protein [Alcaligenaceae bacterium]|nr:superoxide dismutase family protein [Alcaligenaceae bacterium]
MRHHRLIASLAGLWLAGAALADTTVQMHQVTEQGIAESAGTVTISESAHGLVFTPQLQGLAPGTHGFHIHENPSCDPAEQDGKPVAAGAAGGHYDPEKTGRHGFPWGDGHLGDLPAVYVDSGGNATNPVLAPRIKELSEVSGRSLMVHKGGDNHADHPEPLGGGGARIACGVISPAQ